LALIHPALVAFSSPSHFFNLSLHKVIVVTSSLFDFIRVVTLDVVLALTLMRL
jgi:hypothetical protein